MTTSVEFARNAFQCATINTGSQKSSRAVVQDCKTVFAALNTCLEYEEAETRETARKLRGN